MNINWCRHFNGVLNPTCRAGVRYVWETPTKTWPCHREGQGGACSQRSLPTQEEVDAHAKEMDESLRRALRIVNLIPPGRSGKMKCPNCGSTIYWTRSPRNNHLHAKCETAGCFAVMQ